MYADDLVLISRNAKNLQHNLDQLSRTCEEFGMKVNVDKSKTMVLGRNCVRVEFEVQGKVLEQVPDFNYLGSVFCE